MVSARLFKMIIEMVITQLKVVFTLVKTLADFVTIISAARVGRIPQKMRSELEKGLDSMSAFW